MNKLEAEANGDTYVYLIENLTRKILTKIK